MSVNEKMKAIADSIRGHTPITKPLSLDEMPSGINDVYNSGYNAGYILGNQAGFDIGKVEGIEEGKKAEYDAFWDVYQKNGDINGQHYYYAFAYSKWNDENYNPKYPIIVAEGTLQGRNIFQATSITDTKVPIYANGNSTTQCFYGSKSLKKIRYFEVKETTAYNQTFQNSTEIEELTIGGVIGQNGFNVQWSTKLNHDSLMSIINALKDYSEDTSGTEWVVTIGETNKAKLTADELAVADAKGWQVQ